MLKGRKIGQRKLRVAITLCGAPYCCHYSVINIDACVHVGGWSMQVFQCVSVRVYCSLIRSILEDAWQNYRQITTGWFARLLSNSVLLRLALSLLFYMDRLVWIKRIYRFTDWLIIINWLIDWLILQVHFIAECFIHSFQSIGGEMKTVGDDMQKWRAENRGRTSRVGVRFLGFHLR